MKPGDWFSVAARVRDALQTIMMFTDNSTYSDLTGRYGFTIVEVGSQTSIALLTNVAVLSQLSRVSSPMSLVECISCIKFPVILSVVSSRELGLCRFECPLTTPRHSYCGMHTLEAMKTQSWSFGGGDLHDLAQTYLQYCKSDHI